MVKKRCHGNEGFGLAWDRIEVRQTNLFITTTVVELYRWILYKNHEDLMTSKVLTVFKLTELSRSC